MATLAMKRGVQPRGLIRLIVAVANVAQRLDAPRTVTITSCIDSKHSDRSHHYRLGAIDVRSKNFGSLYAKRRFLRLLKDELGNDANEYDILLEQRGKPNEHFHLEYDP